MIGEDEIDEIIAAAIAAEAWFTHQECVDVDKLDYYAFRVADGLRVALKHIEDTEPERITDADSKAQSLFPHTY